MNQFKEFGGDATAARAARIRRAALALAAIVLAVTSLSAFIRLSNAGLGCADWPLCYGENLRAAQQGLAVVEAPGVGAARFAHRVLGGAALLVVLVIAMASVLTRPVLRREGAASLALLALAGALALLGIVSAGARVPAVTLGNLLGGFLMLALATRIAWPAPALPARLRWWAGAGALLLLAQVALGGIVSAGYAGLSCPGFAACLPAAPDWSALDPMREPAFEPSLPPVNASAAPAQALHRAGAVVVALVLLPLAAALWRAGARATALSVAALLVLQAGLGTVLVAAGLPLAPALLHNTVAALLVAALTRAV